MTTKLLWDSSQYKKTKWRCIRVDMKNGNWHEFNIDDVDSVKYIEE